MLLLSLVLLRSGIDYNCGKIIKQTE
jgi:hypothetical protein